VCHVDRQLIATYTTDYIKIHVALRT